MGVVIVRSTELRWFTSFQKCRHDWFTPPGNSIKTGVMDGHDKLPDIVQTLSRSIVVSSDSLLSRLVLFYFP